MENTKYAGVCDISVRGDNRETIAFHAGLLCFSVTGEIAHSSNEQATSLFYFTSLFYLYFGIKGLVKLHFAGGYDIQKNARLVESP